LTGRNLWYVRRGDKVAGPFPSQVITNNALLGRVKPSDELSMDRLVWQALVDVPELLPQDLLELHTEIDSEQRQWREERLKAARRWADERINDERRHDGEGNEPRGEERRKNTENPDVLAKPHHYPAAVPESGKRAYLGAAIAVAALLLLVLGLLYFQPVNPVKVGVIPAQPQCQQAAAPRANWSGCDKQEMRLRGADLSGSNLAYTNFSHADLSGSRFRQARLVGANLGGALLNDTDLVGADLSYADLHDASLVSATLTGATLDHAIWPDGRVCATGSLGQCR